MAIEPLEISDDTSHKVTMFNSPDHSIKPLVDFIKSAEKSIDMYIPEMISWTYGSNKPRVPLEWLKEENPLFQALANVGVEKKTIPVRIVTNGPQNVFIPMMADMWEWLLLQNAQVNFSMTVKIKGILIIVDGGDKILLTTMDCSKSSFVTYRESSIIMEKPNDKLAKYFADAFQADFLTSVPFVPPKEVILSTPPVKIDPASTSQIQTHIFPITSISQPPPALVDSPIDPYISEIVEVDDAEFVLAMVGPDSVESKLIEGLTISADDTFLQVAIQSLPYSPFSDAIIDTYKRTIIANVLLSYTLDCEAEVNASNANLLTMKNAGGMFTRLVLGPLYDEHPDTKDYFTHNGQAYINNGKDGGTLYFMTGDFSKDAVSTYRNFYVAFKSKKMSEAVTRLFSGDKLFSTVWDDQGQKQIVQADEEKPSDENKEPVAQQQEIEEPDSEATEKPKKELTWIETWLQSKFGKK